MSEEKNKTISFRVSDKEYEKIQEVAAVLFKNEKIKTESVGAFARAATFIQVNKFIEIQQMQEFVDQREKQARYVL